MGGCISFFASLIMYCSHNKRSDSMGHSTGTALLWWLLGFCENWDFHVLKGMDFTQIFKYKIVAVLFYWVSINGL